MKNYIDFARLGKLFLMEIRLHRKMYLILMSIIFAVVALKIATAFALEMPFVANVSWLNGLIVLTPFLLYHFVYHQTNGLAYAMLPATSLEKIFSAWIQCVVIAPTLLMIPVLLLGIFFDISITSISVLSALGEKTTSVFSVSFSDYLFIISVQSLAFWGVFWFKHKKFAKTVLTLALIGLSIAIISGIIVKMLSYFDVSHETVRAVITGNREGLILFNTFVIPYSSLKTLRYLGYLIVPILPWTLAFFKFRRTQI
jgi:hypothetical protein